MKRKPALQALSREHHTALVLANACLRAVQTGDAATVSLACQRAVHALANELEPHFSIEERTLLPLLTSPDAQPLLLRTASEHEQLRGLLPGLRQHDVEALNSFGQCLTAHVRFEERELFPVLEALI